MYKYRTKVPKPLETGGITENEMGIGYVFTKNYMLLKSACNNSFEKWEMYKLLIQTLCLKKFFKNLIKKMAFYVVL